MTNDLSEIQEKEYARYLWEKFSHTPPSNNNIDKILSFPEDMAGVLARAKFKNDEQRIAAVLFSNFTRKFKLTEKIITLRELCASTLGEGALGKVLQIFASTNMVSEGMLRASLGLPKSKEKDVAVRSNDLRPENIRQKEIDSDHG